MNYSNDVKTKKTKNSLRNVITGFVLKIFELILPFIVRTVLIYTLGMEYSGLNSLFTSILQTLNIAELGIGTCMVVHMYKPISDGDNDKLCALMRQYKIYYRIIGAVVLVLGLVILPFLPNLITGDVPADVNLYVLYLLNLATTVISYWLFAYRNSLFTAHQRLDVVNNITFGVSLVKYISQIIVLYLLRNYYVFLIISLVAQILINIITAIFSKKYYPDCKPVGHLPKEEKKSLQRSIKDIFTGQIGNVVTNSVDSIVISAFLGLLPLSIYQNYYYILIAIIAFFTIFYNSVKAAVGNGLINKSMDDNYKDFHFLTFCAFGMLAFSITCMIGLFQTFMEIWVGQDNMLDNICVILFGLYLLSYETTRILMLYKDACGKWHADRFRPLIAAVANLIINIILVNLIGIYGILISTIVSYALINVPWLFHRLFIDVFEQRFKKKSFLIFSLYLVEVVFISAVGYILCSVVTISNLYVRLIVQLVIASSISIVLYLLFNLKSQPEKRLFHLVKRFLKKLLKKDSSIKT